MRILNDFECENHHISEHLVDHIVGAVQCPHCDLLAFRKLASPRSKLEGITGAFPGAYSRWERVRAEKLKEERKKAASHGE